MTKMNSLEMTAGNVFNLQEFEQDGIKFKQESLKILLVLFLAQLMMICC